MKLLFISVLFSICQFNVIAQINHFIYFQTENKQPFYVKINDKILSSSPAGYLIVPKLKQGDYKIAFGFPRNEIPEKVISYTVDKKDAGYIIKNFGEKGWGLFNLQTFDVIMPGDVIVNNKTRPVKQNQDDAFSNMLARVVDDSTIRQKDVADNEEQILNNKTELSKEGGSLKSLNDDSAALASKITRILNIKNKDGVQLIYTDQFGAQSDTIRIFLAGEITESNNESKPDIKIDKAKDSPDLVKPLQKEIQQQPASNDGLTPQGNPTVQTDPQITIAKSTMLNSDCKGFASEEDFRKLRKKMAAEHNEDDMIKLAKKAFKSRCFTTDHIRSLSALFLKDEGKYNFFDASYPFVSDSNIFSTLESQLTDAYYISRFKAMIHH